MSARLPMPRPENPSDLFGTLQREVNRVFDQMFGGSPASVTGFAPKIEVKETAEGLTVTAELPGIEEKDVEVSLDGDMLTLSGEKRAEKTEDKEGLHLAERSYGSFRRSLALPWSPNPADATAAFDKGVLTVTLKRPPEAEAKANRIPIGKPAAAG
ncbi:Hsp20/alpha crystallin family protein [Roseomonas sp. HJA6]|uniref:Hsp20/alpha crystallin family protein n=1 Tax=Roseomonas alba TaxID=2846776 RepID=A0ABS7A2L9_9PROT|nr:Hsp20/alpha crystallin family protein [Neoroseomonas alba]MBW6396546.1 Hsp20/alpha crystallin family protein [Neoroseomonas alba]